jgi:hypothetical protein
MTGLGLHMFKCVWFDDEHYFDFFRRLQVRCIRRP